MNTQNPTFSILRYLIVVILSFTTQSSFSAHFLGGEMTYQCLSSGEYAFNLTLYRDCAGGGAEFDSNGLGLVGTVTVYRGSNIFNRTVTLGAPTISRIESLNNPCFLAPVDTCIEKGVYNFDLSLPLKAETYTVVYQRCCRVSDAANIIDDGTIGVTYFVQITEASQNMCHGSPEFKELAITNICANQDLFLDHMVSNTNIESSYIYLLCPALIGGGIGGLDGDIFAQTAPNGLAPNPDMPPPYFPVTYYFPQYQFDKPLGGNPPITIHPTTGQITGHPITTGNHVVNICVAEYQNGILLSETRREFQYSVINCQSQSFTVIDTSVTIGTIVGDVVIQQDTTFTIHFENPADGCDSFVTYDIQAILSIDAPKIAEVQIFPNPFDETINFNFTTPGSKNIRILNSKGQLISEYDDSLEINYSISTDHLPSGLYLIEIQSAQSIQVSRVIKY